MRKIHYITNDAYLGMAVLESLLEETLLFLELPDNVFIGKFTSVMENVNLEICQADSLPVIRSLVPGRSYLFESGKNLLIALVSNLVKTEQDLQVILLSALKKCGIENISIRINDILYGQKQLGMTAPEQKKNGLNFIGGQITFGVDFDKNEKYLKFPKDKWVDKFPATNIREWIQPVSEIKPITISEFISTACQISGMELEDGVFTESEMALMNKIKNIYKQDSWLKYGQYD